MFVTANMKMFDFFQFLLKYKVLYRFKVYNIIVFKNQPTNQKPLYNMS